MHQITQIENRRRPYQALRFLATILRQDLFRIRTVFCLGGLVRGFIQPPLRHTEVPHLSEALLY